MAFKLKDVGGYGTGALGDVTISSPVQVNSYANVTAIGALGYQLAIGANSIGAFGGFVAGQEILFHATGCLSTETTNMGAKGYATILGVNGSILTLDKPIPIIDLTKYFCQAVTVPSFGNLTVTVKLSAPGCGSTYGGIIIVKATNIVDLRDGGGLIATGIHQWGSSGVRRKPLGIVFSNAELANRMIMGDCSGICIVICKDLKLNNTSRLGGNFTGAGTEGKAGIFTYTGGIMYPVSGGNGGAGFGGGANGYTSSGGIGDAIGGVGGWNSLDIGYMIPNLPEGQGSQPGYSAYHSYLSPTPCGSSVCIFASSITGFIIDAFSTGGRGSAVSNGGHGSSGGGAGFGYIATNTVLPTNAIAYAQDTLYVNKTGLIIPNTPLDCTALTQVDGFTTIANQPANTDIRVAFSINNTAVLGSRTYPISTNTVAGDTVLIKGITFTAVASGATGNQYNVGTTTTITATNLTTALNANTTINALYTATSSTNIVTLTEKTSAGNTPGAATKTGTIIIDAGTVTTSLPVGSWYKLSGSGAVTLAALPTQTLTIDSMLAEGNTVAELTAATSIVGFVGKTVKVAIALMAPGDATAFPSLQLAIKGKSNQDQTTRSDVSAPMILATEMVDVIDLSAAVTASGGATATVLVSLQQNGTWTSFMPLTTARRQQATALKFQANYAVASIGTGSAKVERVTALYRSNNAVVSGDTAEIVSVTEDFGGVGMRFGRITVKHQVLKDAQLRALMAMRPVPKTRERIPIAIGNGQRQTVVVGVKDAGGVLQADTGINHNTIRLWHGSQEIFDYDFNTEMSQISTTAPEGVTAFASYSYGWEPETWLEMTRGTTQVYDDANTVSTEFTYVLPSGQSAKGVAAVKVLLEKPGGTVSNKSLGVATGKTQMIVLDHAAKLSSIVVTASVGSASWSYDESSRILTVVAQKDATLTASYDWVAETPVCSGFVACWNE